MTTAGLVRPQPPDCWRLSASLASLLVMRGRSGQVSWVETELWGGRESELPGTRTAVRGLAGTGGVEQHGPTGDGDQVRRLPLLPARADTARELKRIVWGEFERETVAHPSWFPFLASVSVGPVPCDQEFVFPFVKLSLIVVQW